MGTTGGKKGAAECVKGKKDKLFLYFPRYISQGGKGRFVGSRGRDSPTRREICLRILSVEDFEEGPTKLMDSAFFKKKRGKVSLIANAAEGRITKGCSSASPEGGTGKKE